MRQQYRSLLHLLKKVGRGKRAGLEKDGVFEVLLRGREALLSCIIGKLMARFDQIEVDAEVLQDSSTFQMVPTIGQQNPAYIPKESC